AYKPFGNGQRACIGRQFAMHEATLVLGMILQRFKLVDHRRYQLKIKETLTLKPDGFAMKVRPRPDRERAAVAAAPRVAEARPERAVVASAAVKHGTPLLVLYGSNMGTAEERARQIAQDGEAHGFATTVAPLDVYTDRLPREGVVVVA